MNINKIITETINSYIARNVIQEKKRMTRADFEKQAEKAQEKGGGEANPQDKAELQQILQKPIVNVSQVADNMASFEDHASPQSKQSHLRKVINGEKPMSKSMSRDIYKTLQNMGINPS